MKKLLAGLLVVLSGVGAAHLRAAPQVVRLGGGSNDLFNQIEQVLAGLTEITGMKPVKSVAYDTIDKARVNQFLNERINEFIKPEEIRAEELALKKFGFVPQDFDLKKTSVDLMTEQAAAFYDFRKKKLFILESAPEAVQQVALVHELAHALADQHFNLEQFIDLANKSDDSATARMAVMEGQATWLMSEYLARRTGQSLKTSPAIVQLMSRAAQMSQGQFPVFDAAPLYMRETLLFPYSQGMLFQHALVEKFGQEAFVRIFREPPVSSQQILHPEKYFREVKPTEPELPSVSSEEDYEELTEGYIGELDHAILLRQYASEKEADSLSNRWKGGRYRVLEQKKDKHTVLAYVVEWESEASAREYFSLYRQVLAKKWKAIKVSLDSERKVEGRGDDGYFILRLNGARVSSLEGMNSLAESAAYPKVN